MLGGKQMLRDKERMRVEIVNKEDSILYLKDKYYTPFLDLAIVYYIDGVHKYFMIHQEDIFFNQVLENIRRESSFCLKYDSGLYLSDMNGKNISIVAILDTLLLDSIQKELKDPFYILPQSKYELRIIPVDKVLQREKLESLQQELIASNDDLPADYIVSNHIYYYNNGLSIAV